MFVSPKGNDTLRLFSASELTGNWTEHPMSPIVADDPDIARPGGRLIVYQDSLYRMGQDCSPSYGNQLHAFEITEISPTIVKKCWMEPVTAEVNMELTMLTSLVMRDMRSPVFSL